MTQESICRLIEIVALGLGISLLSLSNLKITNPLIYYIGILILVLILVSMLFTWKRSNFFTKKKTIDRIWQNLLSGASESIEVFAGDVSWAQRDKEKIKDIT